MGGEGRGARGEIIRHKVTQQKPEQNKIPHHYIAFCRASTFVTIFLLSKYEVRFVKRCVQYFTHHTHAHRHKNTVIH